MYISTASSALVLGFFVSFIVSIIIYKTKHLHSDKMLDQVEGVQKFHSVPTPRIGGIAIAGGLLAGWLVLTDETKQLFGLLSLAGLPVFAFGLAEDIFKTVSVRARLLASVFSGLLFYMITGYAIERIFVWWFDPLLSISAISIGLTVFAIASATNAINIIDGFHGLASGTILLILFAIGFASQSAGDTELFVISSLLFTATLGFFLVNFPFGKLFLGDGGAYFMGFAVAALAVMLPARNSEISPWISPLILSYPLTELVVSMTRKARLAGRSVGEPDGFHLHMLVYRIVVRSGRSKPEHVSHALTSLVLWTMPILSTGLVIVSDFSSQFSYLGTLGIFLLYLVLYNTALRLDRKWPVEAKPKG
ncbi:MAG: glycosyltransferase family 4 protein [Rhodobacteraceae bacterium]|nr:glycosyltransferase family 4 protein [Paracoccaceae bacterium]